MSDAMTESQSSSSNTSTPSAPVESSDSAGATTTDSEASGKSSEGSKAEKAAKKEQSAEKRASANSAPQVLIAAWIKVATEAAATGDPELLRAVAEGRESMLHLERVAAVVPVNQKELDGLRTASRTLRDAFYEDQVRLKKGLRSVKGGDAFVQANTSKDPVVTFRQLETNMTPAHLGHNKPLLTAAASSYQAYATVDGDYQALATRAAALAAQVADAKARLALDLEIVGLLSKVVERRQRKAQHAASGSAKPRRSKAA